MVTSPNTNSGAVDPESSQSAPSGPSLGQAASTAALEGTEAECSSGEEEDGEGEEDGQAADQTAGAGEASSTLTSKQRKKKKSKLAAKLKRKLGGGGAAETDEQSDAKTSGQTISGTSKSSGPNIHIAPEQLRAVREAMMAEQGGNELSAKMSDAQLLAALRAMHVESEAVGKSQDAKQKAQKALADHKFWKTQPVIKPGDGPIESEGPIEPNQPPSEVRTQPYPLPNDFEWVRMNIDDQKELQEIFDLLTANYVEDDDATMRFKYSREFLHWVLKHPGYHKEWHIGVRVTSSKKLVAFISGIPHELRVREQSFHSTEINFLCVHKKLRSKRLAPVLIKEVTRQCHLLGVFQAIYTAGVVLPTPVACSRYYHRTLDPKKLVEIEFAAIPSGMSPQQYYKTFELPTTTSLAGLREMRNEDVPAVGNLLRRYLKRFDMAPRFTDEEIRHVLMSGCGTTEKGKRIGQVTWTYVVENVEGRITDMFAFYSLPSSVLGNSAHDIINAAYLFYYATDVVFSGQGAGAAPSLSSSSAAPSSSASAQASTSSSSAADLEPWQRSGVTALNPAELDDEKDVVRWEDEPTEVKEKLAVRLNELMHDLLVLAKNAQFDVVNCLTVMDNPLFLQSQKFGPGDGFLRFYLFNWRVNPIAGGMGSRAGELEVDPLAQSIKLKALGKDGKGGSQLGEDDRVRLAKALPKAGKGSGMGIVMV